MPAEKNVMQIKKPSDLTALIQSRSNELKQPGVLSIRPGYKLENDWPTKEPAIVVIKSKDANVSLPAEIDGVKVDVRNATAVEEMKYLQPEKFSNLAAEHPELRGGAYEETDPSLANAAATPALGPEAAKPEIPYTPPAGVELSPVSGNLTFTCHASPDAGWPVLKKFLSGTRTSLTVGLYDFTSQHILDHVETSLAGGQSLRITLDNPALNPTADQSDPETIKSLNDALGQSLQAAWALVRSNKEINQWVFPTAYHIKVAVRDSNTVWLSSGNWNNSNQPDIDPIENPQPSDQQTARKSDRDWHVVVENEELARNFEAFLKHDFDVANSVAAGGPGVLGASAPEMMPADFQVESAAQWQFFAPLRLENEPATITPLLTPDKGVYETAMLQLIQSAQEKLYIQLQYIHPSETEVDQDFATLLDAVVNRIGAGVDVRIILSQFQKSQGWLERLQEAGVDLSKVKIQNGVHNKGFVIDSKVAALGSQNWSGDGVLRNRDASVIIKNAKAAAYYEQIFLHDWNNIARQSMR